MVRAQPMYPLQRIFERLNDSIYCRYTQNGDYPTKGEDGEINILYPRELLEVGRQYPREQVMLAYFGEEPTRVLYAGEDIVSMRKTVDDLRIPNRVPENLGEVVFYLFRGHLKKFPSGPISLEQLILPGKERHFEYLLKKLLAVYKAADDAMLQTQPSPEELIAALDMPDVH